jgi:hypothetical protein
MCPQHRREKLAAIKSLLAIGAPCYVVSTPLIGQHIWSTWKANPRSCYHFAGSFHAKRFRRKLCCHRVQKVSENLVEDVRKLRKM